MMMVNTMNFLLNKRRHLSFERHLVVVVVLFNE